MVLSCSCFSTMVSWCDSVRKVLVHCSDRSLNDRYWSVRITSSVVDLVFLFYPASMLRHNQETNDKPQTLRVGSLVVRSLGQLLPHQLQSFHTRDAVYPVSGCVNVTLFPAKALLSKFYKWALKNILHRIYFVFVIHFSTVSIGSTCSSHIYSSFGWLAYHLPVW